MATSTRSSRRSEPSLAALVRAIRTMPAVWQDGLLALAVVSVQWVGVFAASDRTIPPGLAVQPVDAGAYVLIALGTAPILLRRQLPVTALVATLAALLTFAAVDYAAPFVGYAIVAALYSVVVYRGLRWGVVGAAVTLTCLGAAHALSSSGLTLAGALVDLLTVATGVGLGDGTRNRIAAAAANEARLVQLAREEERRADEAVAEERTRIARELHDLVAHSISVVAVQAGMGHHLIDQDPAKAKEALATIEQASRQSLTEMRRMLGILRTRTDTPANDLAPQPSLRSLDVLVDQIRRAGVPVDVTIGGEPRPLSSGTDLSAYRIVQEALTNVMKHAGDAAVRIEIRYAPDGLHLTIDDDGRGLSAQPNEDGGFGLVGMRERAAVVSGNVATGPRPGGGFRVAAHLPYEGALT